MYNIIWKFMSIYNGLGGKWGEPAYVNNNRESMFSSHVTSNNTLALSFLMYSGLYIY